MKKVQKKSKLAAIFPKARLFDSHCHLDQIPGQLKKHVEAAMAYGVEIIVAAAIDLPSSIKVLSLQSDFPEQVIAAIGIHPEILVPGSDLYSASFDENYLQKTITDLRKLLTNNQVRMIGECGLDYYWLNKNPTISPLEKDKSIALQNLLLKEQLKLARLFDLPVTLHSRASEADCLQAVASTGGNIEVIFHSFTGSYEQGKEILEMGGRIGINGIITYKSANNIRDTFKKLVGNHKIDAPKDLYQLGFLLETDAPLLIPGNSNLHETFNSPKQIPFIWNFIYNLLNG